MTTRSQLNFWFDVSRQTPSQRFMTRIKLGAQILAGTLSAVVGGDRGFQVCQKLLDAPMNNFHNTPTLVMGGIAIATVGAGLGLATHAAHKAKIMTIAGNYRRHRGEYRFFS